MRGIAFSMKAVLILGLMLILAWGYWSSPLGWEENVLLLEDARARSNQPGKPYYVAQLYERNSMPLADESLRYSNPNSNPNSPSSIREAIDLRDELLPIEFMK